MKGLINNKYLFWFILTIPLIWLVIDNRVFGAKSGVIFYWTGAWCGFFVLLALAVTPITRMFPTASWRNGLIKKRRYLGVASFGYLFVHTVFWLMVAKWERILHSFSEPDLIMAWISLVLFTLLAVTSNDFSIRKMGRSWKKLQNWVYFAALLGFLHWFWAVGWDATTIATMGGAFSILMIARLLRRNRTV